MKMLKLQKIISITLLVTSVLALNPIGANAEWKEDNQGWRYSESNSWSIGWRNINGNWYYFDQNGYMLKNTLVQGWKLDSNGIGSKIEETANTAVANSIGNSNGNISNLGLATIQGEYIYYIDFNDYSSSINKIKIDGTGKEVLAEKMINNSNYVGDGYTNLNVIGDWIYYSEFDDNNNKYLINKIKIDGTSNTTLISYEQNTPSMNYLNVVGDWIYYTYSIFSSGSPTKSVLCRMKIDGNNNKILKYNYDYSYGINIANNFIYYRTDTNYIFRIQTDGGNLQKVNSEICNDSVPVVDGESLYYTNFADKDDSNLYTSSSLNKVDLKTGYSKHIITENAVNFSQQYINVNDSWIYYAEAKFNRIINDWEYSINKIKIDGSDRKQLISNYVSDYSYINVVGDWIFYRSNNKTYKMKIDGSYKIEV